MEQKTSDDNSSEQPEDASISPPPKKAKRQLEENSLSSDSTSNDSPTIAGNLNEANVIPNQQPANIEITVNQQSSKIGIFNFILPSEEDSVWSPGENLDPNSAALKNFRTGGVLNIRNWWI